MRQWWTPKCLRAPLLPYVCMEQDTNKDSWRTGDRSAGHAELGTLESLGLMCCVFSSLQDTLQVASSIPAARAMVNFCGTLMTRIHG
jgi:hypothetical protein